MGQFLLQLQCKVLASPSANILADVKSSERESFFAKPIYMCIGSESLSLLKALHGSIAQRRSFLEWPIEMHEA